MNKSRSTNLIGPSRTQAFTLLELIVIVGVLAVLGALFFPAFGRTASTSATMQCQNNLKQMAAAWAMYSAENGGRLVSAYPTYAGFTGTWCGGNATSDGAAGSYLYGGADPTGITKGLIWPYVLNLRSYRCSLDRRIASSGPTQFLRKPILRSISMNSYMNGLSYGASPNWTVTNPTGPQDPNHPVFTKNSEISRPAATWVVIEEDFVSINDGMLIVDVGDSHRILDLPSRAHDNGAWLNFADGHAELFTLKDPQSISWKVFDMGGINDWQRLVALTTYPLE